MIKDRLLHEKIEKIWILGQPKKKTTLMTVKFFLADFAPQTKLFWQAMESEMLFGLKQLF